ncbi:NAD(P)H-hydrate dehydratase [Algicella marina]|uniref:Bifunctional NAD(P)H-hydrate repair enzyme n=1 Tax=Algicella marina TaxID=2683284 RepID=A0A6P1SZX6_9RHOB|nr:NAD(P)H-hydrate dehydratase [Algicella marina]QHQ34756.1 NAD(P)H-hydrate dehydratase [Algicella marina]
MTELLTAAQMRGIERAAIESGAVTGLELMERAGRGVVEAVLEWRPELTTAPHRAVVLCGPGNNGGDGFVVARLLKERGWDVDVFLYGDEPKLPPDAATNCRRWREMGEISPIQDEFLEDYVKRNPDTKIVVDALFGSGLARPFTTLGGTQNELNFFQAASRRDSSVAPSIISIDVPSGMHSDTGMYPGYEQENPLDSCIQANLTVTFHVPFVGHLCGVGPRACGHLFTKSIGLEGRPAESRTVHLVSASSVKDNHVPALLRSAWKQDSSHKYAFGHALVFSGPSGQGGAARLAARGAVRIGAGLVTVCVRPDAVQEHAAQLNAIMIREIVNAAALTKVLEDKRINALCLGPGMGVNCDTRDLVHAALAAGRNTVLDADALTVLSQEEDPFAVMHEKCVLTPHGGEFARLFPDIAEKLGMPATDGPAYSKVDACRQAAARAGCVVLFKGADTVIASPDGRCALNSAHYERAAPWLATAGSGDVLAGFITGLLARGFDPQEAAEAAAWLHVECALHFGPGLIAEDLPEQLPAVLRCLGR